LPAPACSKPQAVVRGSDDACAPPQALLADASATELQLRENHGHQGAAAIAALAAALGLHSRVYGRGIATVHVVSKAPLPSYRPDLDARAAGAAPRGVHVSARAAAAVELALADAQTPTRSAERSATAAPQQLAPNVSAERPRAYVPPARRAATPATSAQCSALPAAACRAAFLAAVAAHAVVVVSGETGCGKTTQLPAFLLAHLEASAGAADAPLFSIVVTQPRRIAAVSVAARVAAQRGEAVGGAVGYAVRLEAQRCDATTLLFCTTGVLLRRMAAEPHLRGVTHVFVDEIHERGMNEGACVLR
jgi:ATP-dependent RNA helicase DHX36